MMMFAVRISETSVYIQLRTRQYIPGPRPGPGELTVPLKGVRWSRRLCVIFREVLLNSKSTPEVNNHPFSAVCEWLLKYLPLPAATGGRPLNSQSENAPGYELRIWFTLRVLSQRNLGIILKSSVNITGNRIQYFWMRSTCLITSRYYMS
jgi:hypothetical protein